MSQLGSFKKQPVEKLDYDIDYSAWLTDNDGLNSAVATVDPPGLQLPSPTVSSPRLKLWASGGTSGTTYKVSITATTDDGRIKQDELSIKVKDT